MEAKIRYALAKVNSSLSTHARAEDHLHASAVNVVDTLTVAAKRTRLVKATLVLGECG